MKLDFCRSAEKSDLGGETGVFDSSQWFNCETLTTVAKFEIYFKIA